MQSFFWYDLETFGRDPRYDRIAQFAGLRTDMQLNIIDDPVEIFCQPSADYLPDPEACLITGITPFQCLEQGIPEADFSATIERHLGAPGTCAVGYNSLRFDDEFVRHLFFRNLLDPYAREWQNGNSRWDLLDVVRAVRALRPGEINWPEINGKPSNKLESLSQANQLDHQRAHDAMSDVYATISVAKLIKNSAPKLFDYALKIRNKNQVSALMDAAYGDILLHVSGQASAQRQHVTLITPIAAHPTIKNAWVVVDLCQDIDSWYVDDAAVLKDRLYSKSADLGSIIRPAIKVIRANRCPFIATPKVLGTGAKALGIDLNYAQQQLHSLRPTMIETLQTVFRQEPMTTSDQDVEASLYQGFIPNNDRQILQDVRETLQHEALELQFGDPRLEALVWRFRARNSTDNLDSTELERWLDFCRQRLKGEIKGARTLDDFDQLLNKAMNEHQQNGDQSSILTTLKRYRDQLSEHLGL